MRLTFFLGVLTWTLPESASTAPGLLRLTGSSNRSFIEADLLHGAHVFCLCHGSFPVRMYVWWVRCVFPFAHLQKCLSKWTMTYMLLKWSINSYLGWGVKFRDSLGYWWLLVKYNVMMFFFLLSHHNNHERLLKTLVKCIVLRWLNVYKMELKIGVIKHCNFYSSWGN